MGRQQTFNIFLLVKINHILLFSLLHPDNFAYGRKVEKIGTQKEERKYLESCYSLRCFVAFLFRSLNLCGRVFTKMELFYHIVL